MTDKNTLENTAALIRGRLVEISCRNRIAHLASSLSCVDILCVLYGSILNVNSVNCTSPGRDRFILSKGHAAAALYCVLAEHGFFDGEMLNDMGTAGCSLEEHPSLNCVPGVEASTGSLGHGLPIGIGMALASRVMGLPYKVFVIISDGECNEGSVWEAAMFAGGRRLDNLCVIVDFNKWQATGRSREVTAIDPLKAKWESFGWECTEVDGHDISSLGKTLSISGTNSPRAIIAHTVKGKGISFMEDDNNWHYRMPTEEEVVKAKKELGLLK